MTNLRLLIASVITVSLLVGCDTFVSSETRMQRAEKALADNDYGRAAVELRNVVQSEPNNVKARTRLVEALLLSNDRNALDAETAQLADKGARDAEAQAALARVYIAKRDFQGLLDALDRRKLQLDTATEQLRRAQALLGLQKYDEAQALTQQLLKDHPNNTEGQLLDAQLLVVRGDLAGALSSLDKLLAAAPKDAHAWALKGYLHAQRGAAFDAVKELSSAIGNAGAQLSRSEELSTLSLLVEQQLSLGNVKGAEASQKQLAGLFPGLPAASLATAQVAFAKANYTDVVAEMQKLVAMQPELPAARLLLARALAAQGNQRQAESELQRLISAGNQNVAARVALAQVQLKLGENVQALQTLAPVVAQFGDQQSMALLTQAQTVLVDSTKDMADLVASSKREPGNEPLRVVTASTLLRAGQAQQAIELLRDVQQGKFSAARVPLLLRAISKQPNGGSVNAEAERIGNEHAHEPAYLAAIASFFTSEKDFSAASTWLNRALNEVRTGSVEKTQASGELTLLRQLIAVELAAGHKAESLGKAQAYRSAHPNDVSAILLEADLQMDLHDFNAAIVAYRAALERSPSSQLMLRLVKAKQAAGVDKPYQELIEWVRRYPEDVNTRFALADAYLAAKQQREAAGEYEKVIDAQPANVMALNNLAWLYQQQGDKRAESTARSAYALAASSPLVTDTLGWILLNGGKKDEALSLLTKAAEKAPRQPDIQYHYAAALEKNGKAGQARQRLSDLLAKHPNFDSRAEAEQLLARLPAGAG